jgi:hypothetical protein
MAEPVRILTVELEGEDGLVVTFSDGTTTGYVIEELLELRPFREPTAARRSRIDTRSGLPLVEAFSPTTGVRCRISGSVTKY